MVDLDLNINGDARRARAALNDVASGSERAARITGNLTRAFAGLEDEATDAQRALDRVQREIADTGPTAELNAELTRLQGRLAAISDERRVTEGLRAEFRRASASAATLDNELAGVRRELDRLNDEYSRGGDPAVLRRIEEQQRELQRLNSIRRRIQDEDEANQARLARMAEEARRAQARREDEERRRQEEEDNRSFLRRLRRRARNAGDSVGGGLQGAPVPPSALAVGGAIGAAAAVPLLAALGGALTGLAGFGVAGAGIAGAVLGDPEKFAGEWATATDKVKAEFLDATEVFAGPTLDAIRTIGPLVESWNLDDVFADAAGYVKPLVAGVEGFATGVVRGVSAMVNKGEPAVEALSAGLVELGDAAGDAFEAIADGAEGGGEALGDLLVATGNIVRGFGRIVGAAEEAYGYIHEHPVEASVTSLGLALPIVLFDQFNDEVAQAAVSLDVAESSSAAFASTQELLAAATKKASDNIAIELGQLLGLDEATDAATKAAQELDETLKKNGYTLSGNSEKALENRDALRTVVDAWEAERAAAIAAGDGSAKATDDANAALLKHLTDLRAVLSAHGANTKQLDDYIEAVKRASGLTVITYFRNIYSNEGTPMERLKSGHSRLGGMDDYASGGPVAETGVALVGENGPELRFLNKGDEIWDAQKTARVMASRYSGGTAAGGASGGGPLTLGVAGGGGALGAFLQKLVDDGIIQLFDGTGQPVRARP